MRITLKRSSSWALVLVGVLSVGLFGVLFALHSMALLSCDDFFYSLFWREGLSGFVRKNIDHYLHVNGRVLVHLVCETVLHLGRFWFAAVAVALYAALCHLTPHFFEEGEIHLSHRQYILSCLIFALLFMLISSRMVLGKGILWISSFFNYIFPTFFLFAVLVFLRRSDGRGPGRFLLGLLLSFLSGETTEQSGIIALVLLGCLWLEAVVTRRPSWRRLAFIVAALAGYLSIFLSPATQSRAERIMSLDLIVNTFGRLAVNTIFLHRSLPLLVVFSFIMFFFSMQNPKAPKLNRVFLPIGLALLVSAALPSSIRLCAAMLGLFLAGLVLTAMGWIFCSPYPMAGYYQLAITASLLAIPITNSAAVRLTLPMVFGVLLLCLWMLTQIVSGCLPPASRRLRRAMLACSAGALAAAYAIFVPTFGVFAANYRLEERNLAAVEDARQTGQLSYCTDYDPRCSYTQLRYDTYAQKYFRQLYGLEDVDLQFYSENGAAVSTQYYLQRDVPGAYDTIVRKNGVLYAALRSAVTSCGNWSCREECDHVDFSLGRRNYVFSDGWLFDGRSWTNLEDQVLILGNNTYLPVDVLTELLGISFDFHKDLVTCNWMPKS